MLGGGGISALVGFLTLAGCCTSTISGQETFGGTTSGGTTGSGTSTSSGSSTGAGPSTCPAATYQSSPGPLTPRNDPGAAFGSDGLAYIAGGDVPDAGLTNLVEALNPDSGTVTRAPPMSIARSAFALVASPDGDVLYAIGGNSLTGATASIESFDIAAQTWSPLAPLPIAGGRTLAGVLDGGRIVVILPEVLAADGGTRVEVLSGGVWFPGPDLPFAALFGASTAAALGQGDTVYAVDEGLNVQAWNPSLDAGGWELVSIDPDFPGALQDSAFAQEGRHLFLEGGLLKGVDCTEASTEAAILSLADTDAGWVQLPAPPLGRDAAAAAVSPDLRLFVFAGEATASCCTGSTQVLSRTYLGSYDVLDLASGLWEPTHGNP